LLVEKGHSVAIGQNGEKLLNKIPKAILKTSIQSLVLNPARQKIITTYMNKPKRVLLILVLKTRNYINF
jgi:hypothetical protein